MCNGFSSRTSQGGATAFLRPLNTEESEPGSNNTLFDYQVTLQEHHTPEREGIHFCINRPTDEQPEQGHTQPCPVETFRAYWVEIHPDGDLTPSKSRDALAPLHRFPLRNLTQPEDLETSSTALVSMKLITDQNIGGHGNNNSIQKLRLDACEMGVIGRRMSIVNATGMRVAEGVIGWN
ncbi:hypothetical protein EMCG_00329 [[Emmonsia] crescens]|uniref:Uncharacterized protein n=1 Tax=[Emmonsia] crescens TaxID=73230 RepID=A0A0G2HWV6_9EURO|nr:hypothetical protein EMCG_00329 [Emmonsia crescens UAMH 3008]